MTASTEKLLPFDMAHFLDSDELINEYLSQVLLDGDSAELLRALAHIAKAKGINTSINELELDHAAPRFDTVFNLIKDLGIRLQAQLNEVH